MLSLSRSTIGLCRHASGGRAWWPPALVWLPTIGIASAPPCWLPPALPRRVASLINSTSAHSDRHLDRLSRFVCKPCFNKKLNKPNFRISLPSATTECIDTAEMRKITDVKKLTNAKKVNNGVRDDNLSEDFYVWFPSIIANSSHRDGAIYKNKLFKENWFDVDINDRNETRLEPMMFSKPTKGLYFPTNMLQFFSVTLADYSISNDSRDDRDCMLNYVLNHSRDDPINVPKTVGPRIQKKRTVQEALVNRRWVQDIKGALTVQVILEYLNIWEKLENITLTNLTDQVIWRWTRDVKFTTASAYRAFFSGQHAIPGAKLLHKARVPGNANFSSGWHSMTGSGRRPEGRSTVCKMMMLASCVTKNLRI